MLTKLHLVFIAVIALFLPACNLSSDVDATVSQDETTPQVIVVTATPQSQSAFSESTQAASASPASTAALPPTALPTATVPPTPSIDANAALQQAERDMLNGRYENAVALYQQVLEQGDAAPLTARASAAFGLGQAALREGLFLEAVNALTAFIQQFPSDGRVAWAYFLRGDAYLGLSSWNEAIADFQQYLTLRPGLIDSYVYERIADARLALGQFDAALQDYDRALAANRSLVPQVILHEKVAQILRSAGLYTQAIAQYDAILSVAKNAPYRASIELEAAQTLLDSGDIENGLARAARVFNDYTETASAYLAMQILEQHGVELDDYRRGQVAFVYGDYQTAINAFNAYTTQYQAAAIPPRLYLLLGRAYREIGNFSAALIAFQTIIEQFPLDALFGEALLEQGRTYFLSGDIPSAIRHYTFIADNYGYLPQAAEALWRAGYLYSTQGNNETSRELFLRLADAYPTTEQANSGLFIAASAAYSGGFPAIAEYLYARLAANTIGEDQAAAYFWVGRLVMLRGDSATADSAFANAIQAAPESYYAARAADIRNGVQPFQPPASYRFQFDEAAELQQAEDWLRATFDIQQEGVLWVLSPRLESNPHLVRGRELWAVGAYGDAEEEFTTLLDNLREQNDALSAYQLAIYFRSIGAYMPSIVAAADVIKSADVTTLQAPPYIARMRYPAYYLDVILDIQARWGTDPLLMLSLIRRESLFDAYATAAAGEKGLMQVIPSTGDYIAEQLNWPDYQHSDLFRPYAAIEFGAYYLQEQLQLFDGNVPAALSAYNAGPGRASQWLSIAGNDPDAFITTITIDSTRGYVQGIYSYYSIYRDLYGG